RRSPAISTRRAAAGLLRLALVDAFLELLEARPQRSSELREAVRAEQDQHDHQDHEQFLSSKSKHYCHSSAGDAVQVVLFPGPTLTQSWVSVSTRARIAGPSPSPARPDQRPPAPADLW